MPPHIRKPNIERKIYNLCDETTATAKRPNAKRKPKKLKKKNETTTTAIRPKATPNTKNGTITNETADHMAEERRRLSRETPRRIPLQRRRVDKRILPRGHVAGRWPDRDKTLCTRASKIFRYPCALPIETYLRWPRAPCGTSAAGRGARREAAALSMRRPYGILSPGHC